MIYEMQDILNKASNEHCLNFDEIVYLLKFGDKELFNAADEQRKKFVGDEVHLRGLIEFSNICRCNCQYCGLQNQNQNIIRYRLSEDEIRIVENG